jgi:hypothetical protein
MIGGGGGAALGGGIVLMSAPRAACPRRSYLLLRGDVVDAEDGRTYDDIDPATKRWPASWRIRA